MSMKMCEDFALNFGNRKLAVASQQHTVSHFLFTREFLTKNMTVVPHPSYFPVSPIEDKTERLPF
jgi:hypothetical protein